MTDTRPVDTDIAGAMPIIGLAGGVGAGKSAVGECLGRLGCVVIDSDARAKALLDDPAVRDRLARWWGDRVLRPDGTIDREVVAGIVFSDRAQRERLEGLIHPMLADSRAEIIRKAAQSGAVGVVIDAPLLIEAGLDAMCDAVIYVDAPLQERLRRVAESRGWDAAELARRESAQTPLEKKRRRSHYVVRNTGSTDDLCGEVFRVFREIQFAASRRASRG